MQMVDQNGGKFEPFQKAVKNAFYPNQKIFSQKFIG